jgi:hypothetical protein
MDLQLTRDRCDCDLGLNSLPFWRLCSSGESLVFLVQTGQINEKG